MERLPLLTPDSDRRAFKRPLRVWASDEDFGPACRIGRRVLDDGLFTSLEEHFPEVKVTSVHRAERRIAADNEFLPPGQRERLDERGVIRAGSVIRAGDVLVSIVETPSSGKSRDDSYCAPPECDGAAVRQVTHRRPDEMGHSPPQGLQALVSLELVAHRELEVGDVLAIGEEPIVVAGVLEQPPLDDSGQPADLVLSAAVARRLHLAPGAHCEQPVSKANARAAESLEVRATGGYSLITMQPLWLGANPCQTLTLPQVAWLAERELTGILEELTGLKSDNLVARAELRRAVERGALDTFDAAVGGASEMLAVVALLMRSLGLNVELRRGDRCASLALAPATSQELISMSSGLIQKPETLNYRTYDYEPGGIFCPQVFGESLPTRRRRFAHVSLPAPIVSPLWRAGKPSLLEQLLGLTSKQIEGILACQTNVVCQGDEVRLEPRQIDASARPSASPEPTAETGGVAIRTLLARLPPERLPPALRGRAEALAPDIVLVLPPDLRPIVLLDSGNFATSDLNDLLRRLINRRNRLVKLAELKAPQVILDNEQRMLQGCVDELHANCLLPRKQAALGSENQPLKCTLGFLAGFLLDEDSKRVEWAGRARAVIDAGRPEGRIAVPRSMFEGLQLTADRPVLLTTPEGAAWVAGLPQMHEARVIFVSPVAAADLDLPRDQPAECILHRPIGPAARTEAQRLLEHGPPRRRRAIGGSWAQASDPEQLAVQLAAAAASGEAIHLDSPQHLLLAGAGGIDLELSDES